jgi:hypothetical protein
MQAEFGWNTALLGENTIATTDRYASYAPNTGIIIRYAGVSKAEAKEHVSLLFRSEPQTLVEHVRLSSSIQKQQKSDRIPELQLSGL